MHLGWFLMDVHCRKVAATRNVSPFYYYILYASICSQRSKLQYMIDLVVRKTPIPEVDHHQNQLEDRLLFTVFPVFFSFCDLL